MSERNLSSEKTAPRENNSPAVAKMLEYIDEHICEPITAYELAQAAGYSQYHIIRIFKKEMGIAPFEYIRRKRLLYSALDLRSGKARVLDVALDYVFSSQEGFTRAFSNAFGISPKRYSRFPEPYGWHIPYRYLDRRNINKTEEQTMEQTKENSMVIFTQVIERPARKLILYRGKAASDYYSYNEEIAANPPKVLNGMHPWDFLCGIKEALYEPVGVWLPESLRPEGTGIYAHAVEVATDYNDEIPDVFDVIELPPCKYMIFQGEPYNDKDYAAAVGACMEKIAKFNPEVYGYRYDYEIAPKFQFAPMGWRGYIEGTPVIEIKRG